MAMRQSRQWQAHEWNGRMPALEHAVQRVQRSAPRTLERQIRLSSIPAPTGLESARSALLRGMFASIGFGSLMGAHVREDDTGNLIARLEPLPGAASTREAVVCMAHLDTVFGEDTPITVSRDGRVVACPGIGDNGRGLAAMFALAEECAQPDTRARLHAPIEFVATVGEEGEGNLRGARAYFDAHGADASSVLVLDGPGDSTIVHHAVASSRIRVTYTGPGGHPWIERSVPNPIYAAARATAAIARYGERMPVAASVSVTRTGGGESLTAIAERAWYDVDLRALDPSVLARISCETRRLAYANASTCACEITSLGERPGGSLDASHPLVELAASATRWCGIAPQSGMASTDANIPLSRGIPAITIGAGGTGGGVHTAGEWFDDTDASRGVVRALAILAGLAMQ